MRLMNKPEQLPRLLVVAAAVAVFAVLPLSHVRAGDAPASPTVGDLDALVHHPQSEMRAVVERFAEDLMAVQRRYGDGGSRWQLLSGSDTGTPEHRERQRRFLSEWESALDAMDFKALGIEGRIDYLLLRNTLSYGLKRLDRAERVLDETEPLLPMMATIHRLHEERRRMADIDPKAVAATLNDMKKLVETTQKALELGLEADDEDDTDTADDEDDADTAERIETTRLTAHRAAGIAEDLRRTLKGYFEHYDGYDPLFTWWVKDPYAKLDAAFGAYVDFLRQRIVGEKEGEEAPIVGDPVGREALADDLALAMVPYTAEELLEIGRRELEWCKAEMKKAAAELGFDDPAAALEHVKTLHQEPGDQPALVRDLAREAVAFLEERELVTLPPLAKEVWRMSMMSPEQQKVAPFFLGGEVIQVSFPTDAMAHEQKLMSLRGNNVHFARATVHHELIPGHHLQGFMTDRYHPHRWVFSTPFWGEGWALYWEMRLWDLGFPRSPEDRIGMLFWRSHRAARIFFSLGFHLGEMTPEEAIELLVETVGHERDNATAEVRRSFGGEYPPLYQAAYMIGGLQIMALHEELVVSGKMSERAFHDGVLQGGSMPIAMVRARLLGLDLGRGFEAAWRFDE